MVPSIFMVIVRALASESSRCSVGVHTNLETAVNTSFVEGVALMRDEVDVTFAQKEQDSLLTSRTEALDACVLAGRNDTPYGIWDGPQHDITKMNILRNLPIYRSKRIT